MDNNELLQAMRQIVKEELVKNNMQIAAMIEESETRVNIKIENEVTKEIHSLFDGYKLAHEKQWELERKVARLEQQLDEIRTHLGIAG